jgi:hypothetical protein
MGPAVRRGVGGRVMARALQGRLSSCSPTGLFRRLCRSRRRPLLPHPDRGSRPTAASRTGRSPARRSRSPTRSPPQGRLRRGPSREQRQREGLVVASAVCFKVPGDDSAPPSSRVDQGQVTWPWRRSENHAPTGVQPCLTEISPAYSGLCPQSAAVIFVGISQASGGDVGQPCVARRPQCVGRPYPSRRNYRRHHHHHHHHHHHRRHQGNRHRSPMTKGQDRRRPSESAS